MKCHCGAWTQVLETRTTEGYVRRMRLCGNNHRFPTREVREELARTISKKRMIDNVRVLAQRKALYERNREMYLLVKSGKTRAEVARLYNVSRTAVGNVVAQWSLNQQEQS